MALLSGIHAEGVSGRERKLSGAPTPSPSNASDAARAVTMAAELGVGFSISAEVGI